MFTSNGVGVGSRPITKSHGSLERLAGLARLAASAAGVLVLTCFAEARVQVDWVAPTRGVSVGVDAADNCFTADFTQALGSEITVTKRDVDGNLLWVASIDQTDNTKWESATWVAVDSQGAVLVSGTLMSGFSNPVVAASLLLKFAADGTPIFRQVYEGAFDGSSTHKVLVDAADHAYVVGLGVGPAGLVTKVKKFSPAGVSLWSYFDAHGIGRPTNFKFAPNGDLLIAARSQFGSLNGYARIDAQGSHVWSLAGIPSLTVGDAAADALGNTYLVHGETAAGGGTVVKKLDSQGSLLWEQTYPSSGSRVEVGLDDQAVVSGLPSVGTAGAAFFKVDPAGALVWSNLDADGPLGLLLHSQMLLDSSGNAYLAASTLFEMAVCKVRSDGSSAWTATMTGAGARSIALGNLTGSLFVVGGATARLSEPTPGIGSPYCFGAPNSTGQGASIVVHGSTTVSDNDVLLVASDLPPNQPGVFFFGPSRTSIPFGAGQLCVGGPISRVRPPLTSDGSGACQRVLDLTALVAAGSIVPGSEQHFQFWYRDPQGPGVPGFNLTNAQRVVFE